MTKTVLITGGAKGIGAAAVKVFAGHHYNVMINYLHSEQEALSLVGELQKQGAKAMACQADVSRRDQVEAMIEKGKERFGSIDILVNNAGVSQQKLFTDLTEDEWERMMAVHVKGTFNCCQAILPDMIRKRAGKIINISSIWGMVGASCEVHYSTAKAAVIGLTKALAKELGPSGIQVNCVAPGIVETEMIAFLDKEERQSLENETPLMRFGRPEEIANTVFYLASAQADFMTGQVISPNGGFVI